MNKEDIAMLHTAAAAFVRASRTAATTDEKARALDMASIVADAAKELMGNKTPRIEVTVVTESSSGALSIDFKRDGCQLMMRLKDWNIEGGIMGMPSTYFSQTNQTFDPGKLINMIDSIFKESAT